MVCLQKSLRVIEKRCHQMKRCHTFKLRYSLALASVEVPVINTKWINWLLLNKQIKYIGLIYQNSYIHPYKCVDWLFACTQIAYFHFICRLVAGIGISLYLNSESFTNTRINWWNPFDVGQVGLVSHKSSENKSS